MITYIIIFFAILGVVYYSLKRKARLQKVELYTSKKGETKYFVMDQKAGLLAEINPTKYAFTEGESVYEGVLVEKIKTQILYKKQ